MNLSNLRNNELILGDTLKCLQNIDSATVDAGVTSPPYNKQEKQKGWLVKNVLYHNIKDSMPEDEYQTNQINILNELYRIIKPGGSFFYNHKTRWDKGEMLHPITWIAKTNWTLRQEIIWDRTIAANIRGWRFWQVDERIYWLYKPVNGNKIGEEIASKHALLTSIWRFGPERKNPHPAPFPLQLPLRAIASVMEGKNDGIIIDPYVGSGTTCVAANLLGFDSLGIDASPEYLSMARQRLENMKQEREILDKEMSLHKVNKTFKERKETGGHVGKFRINKSDSDELPLLKG